ncbi:MAG: PAC2 family protein, partial [Candidatus Micrarchaeota archaeon]
KPVSPARVYASEKLNLVVLLSEFVIPANLVYYLTDEILAWSKKKKATAIYSMAAIATPDPKPTIHGIASTGKMAELLKGNGVDLIKEGATQGVSGVLVTRCAMEKFPAANLMVQTNKPMDPVATARLLDKMAEIIGFKLDTQPLVKEGEKVEERMKQAMDKMQELHKGYKQLESNPMYG